MKAKPFGFKCNEVIVCYITHVSVQKKHIMIFVRNFRLLSVSSLHHQLERKLEKVRFSQKKNFQPGRTALRHYTGYTVFAEKRVE